MGVRLRNTGPVQWRVAGRRGFPAPRTLREQGPAMLGSTAGGGLCYTAGCTEHIACELGGNIGCAVTVTRGLVPSQALPAEVLVRCPFAEHLQLCVSVSDGCDLSAVWMRVCGAHSSNTF